MNLGVPGGHHVYRRVVEAARLPRRRQRGIVQDEDDLQPP